ncbi:hypothetical protein CC86DRAFT_44260 [Ophiobolus disseminans]|uniref:F-box domain-containing protein n=1 Tax=Ophiobolus disseminans TaxID=1469910 RepID=A0A6A6ZXF9_9PLEO|nr:hypothetical protein CC86DRAFT_44260 [Ophiobolus disseminans]
MTSSNPTIYSLPEELLDRILHFIPHRPTITALCLVSRDLNRIATPHLYTCITLTSASFQFLRPLTLLLWTSSKHRLLVRSFCVKRAYGGNLVPWPTYPGLDELIREMVRKYVKRSEWEAWEKKVRDGGDALVLASLLLRSLENVERMAFDGFELVDPGRGREGVD